MAPLLTSPTKLFFFLAEVQSSHAHPSLSVAFFHSPLCCALWAQKSYQITITLSHTVPQFNAPFIHTTCHGLEA